ncbi:tRNA (adenosine(37)-N6)-threonylcarbamoyltransferase complex ATPase subunit type 1 TsaE [Dolosicoccus paucivorans]|nr:tRNA (adenosine(37)-N6)-threonylcarbamoyltransferase complex ATPase subunit type 1 TsaE [Dolosicoccus paucivorans]SDI19501.1 tRNA threonylcarbamoyladenosine biosynthesis protein TsaE [Dolosicoccus paucivorans]
MVFKIKSTSPETTQHIAQAFIKLLPQGSVVLLEGNLGSGKTTFTKGIGAGLNIKRAIKSPTYTVIKEYSLETGGLLVHVDAYRLEEGGEETVDLLYYLTDQNYLFIEWSQFLEDSLPNDYLKVRFTPQESFNERLIEFESHGDQYDEVLRQLQEVLADE